MNPLHGRVEQYLATRRACGYKMDQHERLLTRFIEYLERRGEQRITVETAVQWATLPAHATPRWQASRLSVVRGFARWLKVHDEHTQIPPRDLLPGGVCRSTPYLYSPAQVDTLLDAARRLADPLRAATFETFIGLLAATGMRPGEAMGLDRDHVDLPQGLLTVHGSKFGKSRQVLLHPSTVASLSRYAQRRDRLCPHPRTPSFLLSGAGTRLNHTNATSTFARLVAEAGIATPAGGRRPRLTDFRHSFAVATLVTWYGDNADVPALLPALSTYLGHVRPATTYWYLQTCPQLMSTAADRLERSPKVLP